MSLLVKQWKGEATLLSFIKTFCYNLNSKRDFEVKYIMISSNKYDIDYIKGIIQNVAHRTLVEDFLMQFNAKGNLVVYGVDGNPITDVGQFMQNIDDDMTWLTNKMDDCDFEFVLTQYEPPNNSNQSISIFSFISLWRVK